MDQHLDAEHVAAFADGSLSRTERAAVEAHAADCARCLQLLATMARIDEVGGAPDSVPRRSRYAWHWPATFRWAVPLAAAATALAVWVNVAQKARDVEVPAPTSVPAPAPATSVPAPAPPAAGAAPVTPRTAGRDPQRPVPEGALADSARSRVSPPELRKDSRRPPPSGDARELLRQEGPADLLARDAAAARSRQTMGRAAAPAPAAPAAAAQFVGALAIVSPDPLRRWRVAGTVVQRSTDGGKTWATQAVPLEAEILGGSSPSADVAWLVGRAGAVLLTTDGDRWQRVEFPQAVDLTAVRARDGREAEVTTADGRVFRTSDGGRTWLLQETLRPSF